MNLWEVWALVLAPVRRRCRDERGYTTETIVVTALLVGLAITVLGIIAVKVIAKGNGLNF